MSTGEPSPAAGPEQLLSTVARFCRHEIGDLLQSIYATVAILQRTLPQDAGTELALLANLRQRAEKCRESLDEVQDLACPIALSREQVNLTSICREEAELIAGEYPALEFRTELAEQILIEGDPVRLRQLIRLLLANAGRGARKSVQARLFRTETLSEKGSDPLQIAGSSPQSGEDTAGWSRGLSPFRTDSESLGDVSLVIEDDGELPAEACQPGVFDVQLRLPNRLPGIRMALAHKIAQILGARLEVCPGRNNGLAVSVEFCHSQS